MSSDCGQSDVIFQLGLGMNPTLEVPSCSTQSLLEISFKAQDTCQRQFEVKKNKIFNFKAIIYEEDLQLRPAFSAPTLELCSSSFRFLSPGVENWALSAVLLCEGCRAHQSLRIKITVSKVVFGQITPCSAPEFFIHDAGTAWRPTSFSHFAFLGPHRGSRQPHR